MECQCIFLYSENEYLETGIVLSTVAFHYFYTDGIAKIDRIIRWVELNRIKNAITHRQLPCRGARFRSWTCRQ